MLAFSPYMSNLVSTNDAATEVILRKVRSKFRIMMTYLDVCLQQLKQLFDTFTNAVPYQLVQRKFLRDNYSFASFVYLYVERVEPVVG